MRKITLTTPELLKAYLINKIGHRYRLDIDTDGKTVIAMIDGTIRQPELPLMIEAANDSNTQVRITAQGKDFIKIYFEPTLD